MKRKTLKNRLLSLSLAAVMAVPGLAGTGLAVSAAEQPAEAQVSAAAEAAALPFTDVPSGAWFYEAVSKVYEKKLMTGMTDTLFGPTGKLKRAQFATILYRIEGEPYKDKAVTWEDRFPDIDESRRSEYYVDPVMWAAENGIITGYTSNGRFGPNDNITREQMAAIMYRYAAYKGCYDTLAADDLGGYDDSSKVQPFALKGLKWCSTNKIIEGKEKGQGESKTVSIDPQGDAIRAECAKIISVFVDVPEDEDPLERLEAAEELYNSLEPGFYTESSYQEFQEKIKNAKEVLEDTDSELRERRAAYTELVEAREALVKEELDPNDPVQPKAPEPEKDATVPDANQYQYQKEEIAAFCHFGPNTFMNVEWGPYYTWRDENGTQHSGYNGLDPSAIFTLSQDFDAETQVKTLKDAGFQKLIVTAKHHDGFCIWASRYTDFDVESTGYKNGNGDILAELSEACTKYDMDMGLYLSPWDAHDESYGYYDENGNPLLYSKDETLNGSTIESMYGRINGSEPSDKDVRLFYRTYTVKNGKKNYGNTYTETGDTVDKAWEKIDELDVNDYNEYYDNQLTEILGNDKYGNDGHFTEVWMDGAKGDGTATQNYTFEKWFATIQKHEGKEAGYPADCMLFGAESYTTVRWIGNETGDAAEETWAKSKINRDANTIDSNKIGGYTKGFEDGNQWTVPEADARITSGWFWSRGGSTPKTMADLGNMYFNTVGHNATLLLNVPPNTDGKIDRAILQRVTEFGNAIKQTFDENLAAGGVANATEVRGGDTGFYGAQNVLDGNDDTYWTTNDGTNKGTVTIKLGGKKRFDVVSIEEEIRFGQRIKKFKIEYANGSDGEWKVFDEGTTIGAKRLSRKSAVTGDRIRVTVETGSAVPMLSEIGVYKAATGFELAAAPEGIDVIDINDSRFSTTGTWTSESGSQFINNTNKYANANSTLTLKFHGTGVILMGTVDPKHGTADVTIDGGAAKTINTKSSPRKLGQPIFISDELSDGDHTLTLTVKSDAIGVEAAYVIDNGGVGMIGLENAAYTMDEDSELTVKLIRVGGSTGTATVTLSPNPGTAIQDDFDTGNIQTITFNNGETQKTATVKTTRNNNKTGDQYFTVELTTETPKLALGLNRKATVTILDTESKNDPGTTPTDPQPQTPEGAYSAESPFVFPEKKGDTATLEAEKMVLYNTGDSNEQWKLEIKDADWASGKKFVNSLNEGDSIKLYYTAKNAGTYSVTLTYRSGSTSNSITWDEESNKITAGSQTAGASSADENHTVTFTWKVETAGAGVLTIHSGNAKAPQLDKFDITMQ